MNLNDSNRSSRAFSAIPDIESYFPSASAESARQTLTRSLERGEGVAALFGAPGLGKTLLTRLLASLFEMDAPVIFLSGSGMKNRRSFLAQILFELRLTYTLDDEDQMRLTLLDHFRRSDYGRYYLLIDDGQSLPISAFEEIRALLDQPYGLAPRFRVALAGTHRLEERLALPKLTKFNQRVVSRCWLEPFSCAETAQYIDRQTERNEKFSFSPDAKSLTHRLTEGTPRLVNQLADLACWFGPNENNVIDAAVVQKSWATLQQLPDKPSDEGRSSASERSDTSNGDVIEFGTLVDDGPEISANENVTFSRSHGFDSPHFSDRDTVTEADESYSDEDEADIRNSADEETIYSFTPSPNEEEYPETDRLDSDLERPRSNVEDGAEKLSAEKLDEEEPDEEEAIESGPIDPQIERRLLERLAHQDAAQREENASVPKSTKSMDLCLEELRLIEMEVAQEASVIRKIRCMHEGLASLRTEDSESAPIERPGTPDAEPQNDAAARRASGKAPYRPKKGGTFLSSFEKIYPDDGKK